MKQTFVRVLVLLFAIWFTLEGQVRLPRLISNGMVLQRDAEVKVWGRAAPREQVVVRFLNSTYSATADSVGNWTVKLTSLPAGGPHTMQILASDTITISDVWVGDVWVCSGQSNMELSMERVRPLYESEIATSTNPAIRQFAVPQTFNFRQPQSDVASGSWQAANPENVLRFSAVAYFFARELYEKYKIPIGLINTSLGGSPAEAWMSEETLREFPHYYDEAQRFKDSTLILRIEAEDRQRIEEWHRRLRERDEGFRNPARPWYDPAYDVTDWKTMNIPGSWAETELGPVNGVVWFRKNIRLPSALARKEALLLLGRIVDADSVYLNGIFVGTTSYQYPPRRYRIPSGILREGENTLVVRVINSAGRGGFVPDKPYELIVGNEKLDLRGPWKYRLGTIMEPLAGPTFIRWKPLGLHNAMLAPLFHYRIKGVIWYQGESNVNRALEYRRLFPAMIRDWRNKWQQGDFPFLFVQLANYLEAKKEPSESQWALLRESQLKSLSVPNTAMAVTIDIGEWNDIHPLNKKDVGKRLALAAQRVAYGDTTVVASGPLFHSARVEGNRMILSFTEIGSGLIAKDGGELRGFAIAGAERKFVWAKAMMEGDRVIVWSDQILRPVAVRYAWADNPEGANLFNKEGLPASPFRTDDWPMQE